MKPIFNHIAVYLLFAVLAVILSVILDFLPFHIHSEEFLKDINTLLISVFTNVFFIWYCVSRKKIHVKASAFSFPAIRLLASSTVIVSFITVSVLSFLVFLFLNFPQQTTNLLTKKSVLDGTSGIHFLIICFLMPIGEELVFRGVFLQLFLKKYPPKKAILFSAIFFGVLHMNLAQLPATFLMGLFLGWLYYYTGNLLLTILLHAFNNLLAFSLLILSEIPSIESKLTTPVFVVVALLYLIVLAFALFYFLRNKEKWKSPLLALPKNNEAESVSE